MTRHDPGRAASAGAGRIGGQPDATRAAMTCTRLAVRHTGVTTAGLPGAGPTGIHPWQAGARPPRARSALRAAAVLALLSGPARAGEAQAAVAAPQPAAILASPPGLGQVAQDEYRRFLDDNTPRAFAVSAEGRVGRGTGESTPLAREAALSRCTGAGGTGCTIWAEGLAVVAAGHEAAPPAVPPPLRETWNYALVPDRRFLWHGPGGRGAVVWAHGKTSGQDSRGIEPPAFLRPLNNAGYDVLRFDREPFADDRDRAAGWLRDCLAALRAQGYRRIIVGGQSRGAWNALQVLDTPGLADLVVAVSPAAQGTAGGANLASQDDEMRRLAAAAAAAPTRLAFVQFADDPFAADEDARATRIAGLRARLGGVMLVDRPPGFAGHGAGMEPAFARWFGGCLLGFASDGRTCTGAP